jgi:hypothetical protein
MRDRASAKVISQDYNSKENIDIEAQEEDPTYHREGEASS